MIPSAITTMITTTMTATATGTTMTMTAIIAIGTMTETTIMTATKKIGPIKKGALHKQLGIPAGQKVGKKRLVAASHSSNAKERKRANFALNMHK
jgi:hypothetical protein